MSGTTRGKNIWPLLSSFVKRSANALGFELVRTSKVPHHNLLGLRNIRFQTIIDVGANTGQFARWASAAFPDAMMYCFEPVPECYRELLGWGMMQKGRVKSFNVALGESEQEVQMLVHTDHPASSSILKTTEVCQHLYPFTQGQKQLPVTLTTLDVFLSSNSLPLIKEVLLKLDVQGFEDRVLRGAGRTLAGVKACIIEISFDNLYEGQPGFMDLATVLYGHGFSFRGTLDQTFGSDGHVVSIDALFIK